MQQTYKHMKFSGPKILTKQGLRIQMYMHVEKVSLFCQPGMHENYKNFNIFFQLCNL